MPLLVEELAKGRGLGNRVRAIGEELLVAHEAGGIRAMTGNADSLEGGSEPLGPRSSRARSASMASTRAVWKGSSGTWCRESPSARQRSMRSERERWSSSTNEAVYRSGASMATDPVTYSSRLICRVWARYSVEGRVSSPTER